MSGTAPDCEQNLESGDNVRLTPEEGGLHGEIVDTPETQEWFQRLSGAARTQP